MILVLASPRASYAADDGAAAISTAVRVAESHPLIVRPRGDSGYTLLSLDRRTVKWGRPVVGTGAVVRYAFVATATSRRDAINCRTIEPLGARKVASGLATSKFVAEILAAMKTWESAANVRFEPADDAATADLLIGFQARPRGIAFADVIRDAAPAGATAPIRQAAICLNPELPWEDAFDGDDATPDVRYVAAHELGHVLGLDHAWGDDRLMSFKYRENVRVPQPHDIAGVVHVYGPPADDDERARLLPVAARSRNDIPRD